MRIAPTRRALPLAAESFLETDQAHITLQSRGRYGDTVTIPAMPSVLESIGEVRFVVSYLTAVMID